MIKIKAIRKCCESTLARGNKNSVKIWGIISPFCSLCFKQETLAGEIQIYQISVFCELGFLSTQGMAGEANIVECSYVESSLTELSFFASPILLGKNGTEKVMPFSNLSAFEEAKLKRL